MIVSFPLPNSGGWRSWWRAARDAGSELAPEEKAELDALVQAKVEATSKRAQAIEDELSR
jgi:hypothetical protein